MTVMEGIKFWLVRFSRFPSSVGASAGLWFVNVAILWYLLTYSFGSGIPQLYKQVICIH